jgi:DHA2 family multidrug resistance protein
VGRLVGRVDSRLIIGAGMILTALSLWQMTQFSLQMDMSPIVWSGLIRGFGMGIVWVPMAALAFVTLQPSMRNEGTALFNLMRNVGSSIGISAVQALLLRNMQVMHSSLAAHVTPFALLSHGVVKGGAAPALGALNREVTRQASMIAYLDDFHLMLIMTLLAIPLLLLVRSASSASAPPKHVAIE